MDEIVKKVEELNDREAEEFEPYQYKYEARDILEKSIKNYEISLKSENINLSKDDKELLLTEYMILKHHLAINFSDTEERSRATPILSQVISYFISSLTMRMKYVLILLKSLNYLAIIWSSLQEEKKSKKYLDQSEQLYKECYSNNNLHLINKQHLHKLESEYTHTLFYFAQLYKNVGNAEKSANYCRKTLQRQLKYDKNTLNKKEWLVNALNIASFYVTKEKFRQSIHCIEAAGKISESIKSYNDNSNDNEDVNIFDDEEDEKRTKADIEKAWGILYTQLLKKSYDIGSQYKATDTDSDEKALANTETLIALDEQLKIDNSLTMFEYIELKEPPEMELASTYKEAKELFIPGLHHLMNAIEFYVLDGFVTDHTKISQHISTIYKYLAFFEQDLSVKCKLHKRRINLLKAIEAQLSVNAYEDLVQDLCYELGSTYENMASLKKEIYDQKGQNNEKNEMQQIKKINDLYSKAIHYLSKYVHIFEFPPNAQSKGMQEIPEQYRFEYFQAHFLMSALYGKLMAANKNATIQNLKKSLSGYEHVVKFYAQKGPIESCTVQVAIAKEMCDLLPLKISSINVNK